MTELLRENINQILDGNDAYICLAFPNWGESRVNDERVFIAGLNKITDRPMKICKRQRRGMGRIFGIRRWGSILWQEQVRSLMDENKFGTEARAGGWDDGFF